METKYYSYDETICPVCGGKIKHPYTGAVTSEQLAEDSSCCLWIEVRDEFKYTLGYSPICRSEQKMLEKSPEELLQEVNKIASECKTCNIEPPAMKFQCPDCSYAKLKSIVALTSRYSKK